jgi:hypothetical protein
MIEPMLFRHRSKVLEFTKANSLPHSVDVGRQMK